MNHLPSSVLSSCRILILTASVAAGPLIADKSRAAVNPPVNGGGIGNTILTRQVLPRGSQADTAERSVHHPGLQSRSFSARFRVIHEASGTVLDEASVLSSELGVRVDQLHEDSTNTFIANYAENQIWFMDRQRHLVHQLPVEIVQTGDADGFESVRQAPAGFIHHVPCYGQAARMQGNEMLHGRLVQRWSCTLPDQSVETQWYSNTLALVLRTRTVNGVVSELTDVRVRTPEPDNFRPPSHFRRVGIEELLNPVVPISSYVEQEIPAK